MMEQQLIHQLNNMLALQIQPSVTDDALEAVLAQQINEWIQHDFNRLVSALYRIDVPEQKLKQILKENLNTDAGLIIARMMIDRQREKIKARQSFRAKPGDSSEELW